MKQPSPYDHLDHRRFLKAWFAYKKSVNPSYSYRLFARQAGQKSSSLLHHVIEGKRNLTPATVEAFLGALKLRAGEAAFFRLLVELDAAPDETTRNEVWDRIATTRRFREARTVEVDSMAYLSNWYLPAIRELVTRPDFDPDPAWIGAHLRPNVPVRQVKAALATLVSLGMLVEEDGSYRAAEASIATPPEVTGLAFRNYHRGMLTRAEDALDTVPGEQRHLLAVTVGVPATLMPRLKEEATAFMQRLMHLCDASDQPTDQVMQLNLQIFPLSDARDPSETS